MATSGDLDFAYDALSLDAAIDAFERTYGARVVVVNVEGPAGGWPVVRLEGPRHLVEDAIREAWDNGDADSVAGYLAAIS